MSRADSSYLADPLEPRRLLTSWPATSGSRTGTSGKAISTTTGRVNPGDFNLLAARFGAILGPGVAGSSARDDDDAQEPALRRDASPD